MKKYIWSFACIIVATTAIAKPSKIIHLDFANKNPEISVYEWICKQAKSNLYRKKENVALHMGFQDMHEWEAFKEDFTIDANIKKPDIINHNRYKKRVISTKLKRSIYNFLEYPPVQNCLQIIDIINEYNTASNIKKIIVETECFGTIEFRAARIIDEHNLDSYLDCNCGEIALKNNRYIIFLDPIKIYHWELSNNMIEALIGHEIGHILHDDKFNEYLILDFYNQKTGTYNIINSPLFVNYKKACEVAADIVGTFGNPKWIHEWINYCKLIDTDTPEDSNSSHPTGKQRAKYLQEIYKNIAHAP